MAVLTGGERKEVELHGVRAEFRVALREELEAARRASASGAIQLVNGRRIAQVYQYLFLAQSALNAPDDSPNAVVRRVLGPLEFVELVVRVMRIEGACRRMAHPPCVAVPQQMSL